MRQYLSHPAFWGSVILVALLANWAWNAFTRKGKLL